MRGSVVIWPSTLYAEEPKGLTVELSNIKLY